MYIDTHCHLADSKFSSDFDAILLRAHEAKVHRLIVIGAGDGMEGNSRAVALADQHAPIYAAVGMHPHDADKAPAGYLEELKKWTSHSKVVALGEMGLDFYYDHAPRDVQQKRFEEQIDLACDVDLPISVHTREAWQETVAVLKQKKVKGVFHCFGGGLKEMEEALDLGFYLSFSGIVTFKKAETLQAVAQAAPLDKMLIETDAPYLAPVPHRGKRNESAFVVHVAEKLAEIRGISVEEMAKITTENAERLFKMT